MEKVERKTCQYKMRNGKLITLKVQKKNLSNALSQLLKDIFSGNKKHLVYRQIKMYNDPKLNPEIYKNL